MKPSSSELRSVIENIERRLMHDDKAHENAIAISAEYNLALENAAFNYAVKVARIEMHYLEQLDRLLNDKN